MLRTGPTLMGLNGEVMLKVAKNLSMSASALFWNFDPV